MYACEIEQTRRSRIPGVQCRMPLGQSWCDGTLASMKHEGSHVELVWGRFQGGGLLRSQEFAGGAIFRVSVDCEGNVSKLLGDGCRR